MMKISPAQLGMLMRLAEYGQERGPRSKAPYRAWQRTRLALQTRGLVELDPAHPWEAVAQLTAAGRTWLRERGAL